MNEPILWTPPGCAEALRLEQFGGMKYWRAPGVGLSFYNLDGEPTYSATVNGNTARDPDPIAALNAAHAKMLEAMGGLVPSALAPLKRVPIADTGDYESVCGRCGGETDDPHTPEDCLKCVEDGLKASEAMAYDELGKAMGRIEELESTTITKPQLIAWLIDRRENGMQCDFATINWLIPEVEAGDPWERLRHGELDDLLGDK